MNMPLPGQSEWFLNAVRRFALLCILCATTGVAAAQGDAPAQVSTNLQAAVAADEQHLWLLLLQQQKTRIFHRIAGGSFDFGRQANGRVALQTVVSGDLLVFFEDGTAYRYMNNIERPNVEAILPGRQLPLALSGLGLEAYAIIPSSQVEQLPPPATEPSDAPVSFEAHGAALALVVYDGRSWRAIAPIPQSKQLQLATKLKPRLCAVNGELALLLPAGDNEHLAYYRFDAVQREWIAHSTLTIPSAENFWFLTSDRIPYVVVLSLDASQREKLQALRLLPASSEHAGVAWENADLHFAPLPDGAEIAHYAGVVGFNQHLCIVAQDKRGNQYLTFAHPARAPAEPTVPLNQMLTEQRRTVRNQNLMRLISLLVLPAVLIGLFVFRRGSMVRQLELPPNVEPASYSRRMAAWAIDFLPFIVLTGVATGYPWYDGLGTLFHWSMVPDDFGDSVSGRLLLWWGTSILACTFYTLMMEIITGRTVGKMILRLRVLSETGFNATYGQIFVRSVIRLIELTPQFWVFVVLVPFSRNRQRLGDIFARTIVVQNKVVPTPSAGAPESEASSQKTDEDGTK